MAATADLQRVIETEARRMGDAWNSATEEASTLDEQRTAVLAVVREYRDKLERFFASFPSGRPTVAQPGRPPASVFVRPSAQGWTVADEITRRLRADLHTAQAAAAEASGRIFAGRQREVAREGAYRVQALVLTLDAEAKRLEEASAAALRARDAEADSMRTLAEGSLADAEANLGDALLRLPPSMTTWDNPSWLSWSPAVTHPHVLLGMLRPKAGQIPGKNHGFAWDALTPAFVSVRDALELAHRTEDRGRALAVARSILLRALACTQPGKLRLSIFDPMGLGQSVSSLLELGEYDRDLIGGKVWSSGDDLQRVLAEHTQHIELVIQKYLRAEYDTLDEFNMAAGEIAEPYRYLVVFDAPTGFDERSFDQLQRIVENGPRCGVATLLVTDEGASQPHGVAMDALLPNLRRIRLHLPFAGMTEGSRFAYDLSPQTDAEAPPEVVRSIVHQVGKAAQESTADAVTFERTFALFSDAAVEGRKRGLPRLTRPLGVDDRASWWTQTTLESVAAPIGLRGARDVATLTFDSSNHAGALLVGRPGSGKSTLLHTFIAGITTLYGPEELELHLIDFKEGVEFKVYAASALPHARTVAIESDREFGVSVLQAIQTELTWRGSLLRGSSEAHSSLQTLREATGERLPRIVLIFDEFQVLFARNDRLGSIAAELLETLIRQGRGFGIHVLLGSQSLAGLDALGSHVPQLLPVRILLPATESDVFKVLGEGNREGSSLTAAGEGILNMAGGSVEANERFRGAVIEEGPRRARVAAMREKADSAGFRRRPVVFEGNAPIPATDTTPAAFADEVRGADARTLRLRFGAPMAVAGSADINLRRESGANVLLVARDTPSDGPTFDGFSLPRAVTANFVLSAAAQDAAVEVVDFLPLDEGIEPSITPLLGDTRVRLTRRRQVPDLLERLHGEVQRRLDEEDASGPPTLLVLYGMQRARDFDQDSVDFDSDTDLPERLAQILRDGPEVGIHTAIWVDTVASISRRLPSSAVREVSWRLAGKMGADDSASFVGVEGASSLRDQQLLAVNEDRGIEQRCTTVSEPPPEWIQDFLAGAVPKPAPTAP